MPRGFLFEGREGLAAEVDGPAAAGFEGTAGGERSRRGYRPRYGVEPLLAGDVEGAGREMVEHLKEGLAESLRTFHLSEHVGKRLE